MSHIKTSDATKKRILKYIDELKSLEASSFQARSRDWADPYLVRVYQLVWNWHRKGLLKERRANLATLKKRDRKARKDKTAFHFLFDHSSQANAKTKSRWVAALLAALQGGVKPKRFIDFIHGPGGIAGRAKEFAASKRRVTKKRDKRSRKKRTISEKYARPSVATLGRFKICTNGD